MPGALFLQFFRSFRTPRIVDGAVEMAIGGVPGDIAAAIRSSLDHQASAQAL